jgi:acyl carrier protein phosphodiesterase
MNLLAHALLAAPAADLMLGGLIGDFVRGRVDPALPSGVCAGIALHRAIDGYTDRHAGVTAARTLFDPLLRRYAGVLLDIWFDHLLARGWPAYSQESLDEFSRRVRDLLDERRDLVPERMKGFVAYLSAHDLPAAYRDLPMIDDVLHGVSRRFKRANPVASALPALIALDTPLQECFDVFFPQLMAFAKNERMRLALAEK